MKVEIGKTLDYYDEAFTLLFYIVNGRSIENERTKLRMQYKGREEAFDRKFDHMIEIFNYVKNNIKLDRDILDFYFKKIGDTNMCLGDFAALHDYNDYDYPIETYEEKIFSYTLEERTKFFLDYITDYNTNVLQDTSNEADIIVVNRELAKMSSLSEENKWNVLQILLNPDKYVSDFFSIIKYVVKLIKKCKKEINSIVDEFYDYWIARNENDVIRDFVKNNKSITMDISENSAIIIPSIFSMSRLSIAVADNQYAKDVLRMGVLLDLNVQTSVFPEDEEKIINTLKALSDKSKMEILKFIKDKEYYGLEIAKELKLSTPTISYHMSGLLSAGLVKVNKETNKVYYSINRDGIEDFVKALHNYLL